VITASLAFLIALAQPDSKYPDQLILKLGREKWFTHYTSKEGESTAAMCDAEALFGAALKRQNDRKLATTKSTTKANVKKLRPLLTDYRNTMVDLGYATSGGGTMWNPVWAGTMADTEEVVDFLLAKNPKPTAKRVVSDVTKALATLEKNLNDAELGISEGMTRKDVMQHFAKVKRGSNQIIGVAKTLPRNQSDRLLNYCLEQIKLLEMAL
jgi:hypothetical protein